MRHSAWGMLAFSVLLLAPPAFPQAAEPCAACHREQAHYQPQTPMGRALELPPDQTILKTHPLLRFSKAGYSYTITRKDGTSTYTVTDGKDTLAIPIHYALGIRSQTFVLQYEGRFYESLVSYYDSIDGLGVTMGAERIQPHNLVEAMGRALPDAEAASCFGCHTTGGVKNGRLDVESMKPGIQCEHCHTGAAVHAADIVHGKTDTLPPRLGQLSAEDLSNFCGTCHRSWETVVRMRVWGPVNVRFQPYRLANSKCFRGTDARIRCVACHDPHRDLARDDASYDVKCLACHASTKETAGKTAPACPVSQKDCVSCHMPKTALPGGQATFTDHEIRIVRPNEGYPN
ncbi:MAG TPA: multiheme c-type cytochrome [Bryobacteraceae bacterium]|nr:multiheme c-type cytochrome [Bryobacteraceae bacterium]